jgi:hypothetical protein
MANKIVSTTYEAVLKAAEKCPEAKEVLKSLYPDVFKKDEIFCKLSDLLIRKGDYKNIYGFVVTNDYNVRLRNLTNQESWSTSIRAIDLSRSNGAISFYKMPITIAEFEMITGTANVPASAFEVITAEEILECIAKRNYAKNSPLMGSIK